jgi:hypothetical protein
MKMQEKVVRNEFKRGVITEVKNTSKQVILSRIMTVKDEKQKVKFIFCLFPRIQKRNV